MTEWPKSRQIAAQYQSSGTTGIGFARYASTGTVTPELWDNIRVAESLAESNEGKPAVEGWAEDMAELRDALEAEGITEKRKVKLEISFTEVIPRSITLEAEVDVDDIEDLEAGYGFSDSKYAKLVQKRYKEANGEDIELLHDEVDHIEVLPDEEEASYED